MTVSSYPFGEPRRDAGATARYVSAVTETDAHRRWCEHVRRWKASGLSRGEYAARAGLNPQTLGWYAWKLKPTVSKARRSKARKTKPHDEAIELASGLPIVEVLPAITTGSGLELVVDDVTVRVPADFEPKTLHRLLDVLEARR